MVSAYFAGADIPQANAEIYKTEIFGPVAIVKTFETEEEVLKLANDTEYDQLHATPQTVLTHRLTDTA